MQINPINMFAVISGEDPVIMHNHFKGMLREKEREREKAGLPDLLQIHWRC